MSPFEFAVYALVLIEFAKLGGDFARSRIDAGIERERIAAFHRAHAEMKSEFRRSLRGLPPLSPKNTDLPDGWGPSGGWKKDNDK